MPLAQIAAQAEMAPPPIPTRVQRCHPDATAVCVVLLGEVGGGASRRTDTGRGDDTSRTWSLRLGSPSFVMDRIEASGFGRAAYLMILVDVSGSMLKTSGQREASVTRFDNTRAAIRAFVSQLDPKRVRVAVAPFGSDAVDATIAASQFRTPETAAVELARMARPSPQANTALYSAVRAGARRLARERQGRTERRALLLVVSDGRNDIGSARDLLPNDSLTAATGALREAFVEPYLLGVGESLPLAQLDSLAIGTSQPYVTAADAAGSIAALLSQIKSDMSDRRIVFWTGEDIAAMGRLVRNAGVSASGAELARAVAWTSPLFALPAFEFPADSTMAASWSQGRTALDGDAPLILTRLAYAVVVAVLLGVFWWVVPRWLWPPVLIEREVRREKADVASAPSVSAESTGIRRDVREAPPRSPAAITAEHPIASR